jgi:hypothetical protein
MGVSDKVKTEEQRAEKAEDKLAEPCSLLYTLFTDSF